MSWTRTPGGYGLYFNRDELKTRESARSPEAFTAGGVRYLAPVDGRHGGSWIIVNEFGLVLCLLNHYVQEARPYGSERPSRGDLVIRCAGAMGAVEASEALRESSLSDYPPFHFVAIDRSVEHLLTWDGGGLTHKKTGEWSPPLTSSSFDHDRVLGYRAGVYRRMVAAPGPSMETLEAFHRQHDSTRSAYSVLMYRPDACTRSLTRVEVGGGRATLRYEPQAWFDALAGDVELRLDLRN